MSSARLGPWLAAAAIALAASPAGAWHPAGHDMITRGALGALPEKVPGFLRLGKQRVAHISLDPDLQRRDALPALKAQEGPEHYFDLEYLEGAPIPKTRPAFRRLCRERDLSIPRVGTLPYAIIEAAQRLTVALAEHRKWPENPHVRAKCWHHAGVLAHYAADACMPLHLTIHYDGRVEKPGDRSPHTGIHKRVDALAAKVAPDRVFAAPLEEATAFDDLGAGVRRALRETHGRLDRVYELEPKIPPADAPLTSDAVRSWTHKQCRRAARLTARIIATAWRDSASIEIPSAFDREDFDAP